MIARKHETQIAAVFLFFLIVGSIALSISGIKSLFLILLISLCGFLVLKSPRVGALILAGSIPISGVIRWSDFSNQIAAGFMTGLIIVMLLALLARIMLTKDFNPRLPKRALYLLGFMVPFLSIVFLHILTYLGHPLVVALMIREYIIPFLSFFIFYSALKNDSAFARQLIQFVFWSTVLVAILNLLHYFVGLNIDRDPLVLHYTGQKLPQTRDFGFVVIPRLNHILGLGTQGGGAAFYMLIAAIGFVLGKHKKLSGSFVYWAAALFPMMAALLTASFSAIFVLLLLLGMYFFHIKTYAGLAVAVFLVPLLPLVLFVPIAEHGSIFEYGIKSFVWPTFVFMSDYSVFETIFGGGLGFAGGGLGETHRVAGLFDRWVFGALLQLGIFGFVSMIVYWLFLVARAIRMTSQLSSKSRVVVFAGMILVGSLGYTHGAAMMHRLYIPLIMLAIAILAGGYCRRQEEIY